MSRPIGSRPPPSPPIIMPTSRIALGAAMRSTGASVSASGVSPWSDAADTVLAFPFVLEAPTTFYKAFWANGTAAGGNSDVAIYDENAKFLVGTGASTLGSGNSAPQSVALSVATRLSPGLYYAGMTHTATTTNQLFRWSVATTGAAIWQALGCWRFASDAAPINLDATPGDITNIAFPVFGLITRSVFDV